jgi:hypothetical protein
MRPSMICGVIHDGVDKNGALKSIPEEVWVGACVMSARSAT